MRRRLRFTAISICISCAAIFQGCKHHPHIDVDPVPNLPVVGEICDDDSVYFQEQVLPIFQSSCALSGCHDEDAAEDNIILDSYENIIETGDIEGGDLDAGKVYEVITESDPDDRMPPEPNEPLSDAQIDLIATWIEQGAVNNSCEGAVCDTLTLPVTFSGFVKPLIESRCEGCHSGDNPSGSLLLTNYDEILDLVDSGNLPDIMVEDMPPDPYAKVTDCQIRMVELWIDNGAEND